VDGEDAGLREQLDSLPGVVEQGRGLGCGEHRVGGEARLAAARFGGSISSPWDRPVGGHGVVRRRVRVAMRVALSRVAPAPDRAVVSW